MSGRAGLKPSGFKSIILQCCAQEDRGRSNGGLDGSRSFKAEDIWES